MGKHTNKIVCRFSLSVSFGIAFFLLLFGCKSYAKEDKIIKKWPNGKVKERKVFLTSDTTDYILKKYNRNGKLWMTVSYQNNKLNDTTVEYSEKGKVVLLRVFKDNIPMYEEIRNEHGIVESFKKYKFFDTVEGFDSLSNQIVKYEFAFFDGISYFPNRKINNKSTVSGDTMKIEEYDPVGNIIYKGYRIKGKFEEVVLENKK